MDDLRFASAKTLAERLRQQKISAQALVEAYLAHLAAINPQLNAVTQLLPDALERARQADRDLAQGTLHGPLHGLPFTVKDVFATVAAASVLDTQLRGRRPPTVDAAAVARLRAAGAILIAKSNCPPNGSGSDAENALLGRTVNPYNLQLSVGGSSGGEAALVAAGASAFGLGSDARGGLRVPAHYCGLAALKFTSGRVPNTGAYNQPGGLTDARTQSGLLARRVEDLMLLAPLLCGPDGRDSGVVPMPWRNPAAVRPAKLTVAYFTADGTSPVTNEVYHAVGAAAQALSRQGVTMVSARPPDLVYAAREVDAFWRDLAGAPGRTVVEFYALWDHFRTALLQFIAPYDAILCPVSHQAAPPAGERDERRFDYTVPFSLTGYPAAVVRVAQTATGVPVAVQVVAQPWREDVALVLARLLEVELGGYQPPTHCAHQPRPKGTW